MKALILSCNTGGGHNAAGRAIREELERRNVPVTMTDTISLSSKMASGAVSGAYVNIAKSAPRIFGHIYTVSDFLSSSHRKSPVYYANKLYADTLFDFILENGFDTIFCPHLFPAEALTYLRRRRSLSAKCYGVATDYTCSPFWEETDTDAFFIPHEELRPEYEGKGILPERLVTTGIPVSAPFCSRVMKNEARGQLSLSPQRRCYLIMTGSMGAGNTIDLIYALTASDPCANIVVLTGNSRRLRSDIDEVFADNDRVMSVGFTERVPLYMDACDVLLTKPGGLSTTEAAVKNIPLVHTSPIPGCESKNACFFADRGMSCYTENTVDAAAAATTLARDKSAQERMIGAQRNYINSNAASDICEYALTHEAQVNEKCYI